MLFMFGLLGYILFYLNFRNNSLKNVFSITSEFDKRYDNINNCLFSDDVEEADIIDYLNICSEEYYFYTHGLIPSDVWDNWVVGMEAVFKQPKVKEIARREFSDPVSNSY